MTSHLLEETLWAAGAAARLRIVQASFADEEPVRREGFLVDEIEQVLKEVPEGKRNSYLSALTERFPMPAGEDRPPDSPPEASIELQADRLIESLPYLGADIHAKLAAKLGELGLGTASRPAAEAQPAQLPEELGRKLSLQPGQTVDPARTVKLLALLLEFVISVDQLVWNVWKNLAPNSVIRREPKAGAEFRNLLGAYVSGDPEVSAAQIREMIDKTRQVTAALLAGIGATGETFARQYLSRYSPASIRQQADAEQGFLVGPEQKCWRKYVELFDEMSGVKIEQEIANAIARYGEQLILGARPKSE